MKYKLAHGLKVLSDDQRDLKLHRLGGIFKEASLPQKSFRVSEPLSIRSQKLDGSDYTCTSRMAASLLEDTEKVPISEEWIWAQEVSKGAEINGGAELRLPFKICEKLGAVEQKFVPISFDKDGMEKVSNIENYNAALWYNALFHKQKSYFRADRRIGAKDHFDSILLSLWQSYLRDNDKKHGAGMGILWRDGWLETKGGVIESIENVNGYGHAIKVSGYEKLPSGKDYLVIQNSFGKEYGDDGLFYMSREIVNLGKPYGAFMFVDLTDKELEAVLHPSFFRKILNFLV